MSEGKVSPGEKIAAVKRYLSGKNSQSPLAKIYDIKKSTLLVWSRNYKSIGADAFTRAKNKTYPVELKMNAVQEYLSGQSPQDEVCLK